MINLPGIEIIEKYLYELDARLLSQDVLRCTGNLLMGHLIDECVHWQMYLETLVTHFVRSVEKYTVKPLI